MKKLEIYDPPMCCKSGICGSNPEEKLVNFASDLEWLKTKGITVLRHGLSLEPESFIKNEVVKNTIKSKGNTCLPLILINNTIAATSFYPTRAQLAEICKIEYDNDEAPPIHREENCCCGVDCDCSHTNLHENKLHKECNCSNAAAEDNCCCIEDADEIKQYEQNNFAKILLIVVFLVIIGLMLLEIL